MFSLELANQCRSELSEAVICKSVSCLYFPQMQILSTNCWCRWCRDVNRWPRWLSKPWNCKRKPVPLICYLLLIKTYMMIRTIRMRADPPTAAHSHHSSRTFVGDTGTVRKNEMWSILSVCVQVDQCVHTIILNWWFVKQVHTHTHTHTHTPVVW